MTEACPQNRKCTPPIKNQKQLQLIKYNYANQENMNICNFQISHHKKHLSVNMNKAIVQISATH